MFDGAIPAPPPSRGIAPSFAPAPRPRAQPRPAPPPPAPMAAPSRRRRKREKQVHLERRYHIHNPLNINYSPRENKVLGSPPGHGEAPRHAPPPQPVLAPPVAPPQSLGAIKLSAPNPSALKPRELTELKSIHQEETEAEEGDGKKHRRHKHKKKKKKKKKRHKNKDKDTTTATRSDMTSQHVELAQQLIRNPGKLLTPAEKAAKGRKKMPMKQPDLDKVEAVYSQKIVGQELNAIKTRRRGARRNNFKAKAKAVSAFQTNTRHKKKREKAKAEQRLDSVIRQVKVSKEQELLQNEVVLAVRMGGLKFDNAVVLEGQTVLKALAAEKVLIAELTEATSLATKTLAADNLIVKLGEAEAAGLGEDNQVVQNAKKAIKAIETSSLQIDSGEKRLKAAFTKVSEKPIRVKADRTFLEQELQIGLHAGLTASLHPVVKDVETLIALMKQEEERIKQLIATLVEATTSTKALLVSPSHVDSGAYSLGTEVNRKFELQQSVNTLRSVQASVLEAGLLSECPEYVDAVSVSRAVDEAISTIDAVEASLAKTVKRTRKWWRKHHKSLCDDNDKVKKKIDKVKKKLNACWQAGVSNRSPAISRASEVLSDLQSLLEANEKMSQRKAEALAALRAAIAKAHEDRLPDPLKATIEAASELFGDDKAAANSISKATTLHSILVQEHQLQEATKKCRDTLSSVDASGERAQDREAVASSLTSLENSLARALADEEGSRALSASLPAVTAAATTVEEAHATVVVMDAVASLRGRVQDTAQYWDVQSKQLVDGTGNGKDVQAATEASMQLLENELRAALSAGVSEQSAVVKDAQNMLSTWRDASTVAEKHGKEQALRARLIAACESASKSRQLGPLKEELAAALAGGAGNDWLEVAATRGLVAEVATEHKLAERLQKATEHAQQQHESASAGLRDPVSGFAAPENDLAGLKAVAMQLGAELQAVLASGLREDSEGVTTARKLLTSVQEQIDTRTAEVATEHKLAERLQKATEHAQQQQDGLNVITTSKSFIAMKGSLSATIAGCIRDGLPATSQALHVARQLEQTLEEKLQEAISDAEAKLREAINNANLSRTTESLAASLDHFVTAAALLEESSDVVLTARTLLSEIEQDNQQYATACALLEEATRVAQNDRCGRPLDAAIKVALAGVLTESDSCVEYATQTLQELAREAAQQLDDGMHHARETRDPGPLAELLDNIVVTRGNLTEESQSVIEARSLVDSLQADYQKIAEALAYLRELTEYIAESPFQDQHYLATHDLQPQLDYTLSVGAPPLSPEITDAKALLKRIEDRLSAAEARLRQAINTATERTITSDALEEELSDALASGLTAEFHAVVPEASALVDRLRIQEELEIEAAIKVQTQARILFAKKALEALRLAREREIMAIFGDLGNAFSILTTEQFKENEAIEKNDYMDKYGGLKHVYDDPELLWQATTAVVKIQSNFRRYLDQKSFHNLQNHHLKRVDTDGRSYTKQEFLECYGGEEEWGEALLLTYG